jgi:hypothetical protein
VDRQIVCRGQLESVWPAHGGVLVQNGKAYVAAGRSTHVDGGIFLWALDPLDGEVCHHAVARTPRPDVHRDRGRAFDMDGAANHLLVGDGNDVYLSQLRYAADLSSKPTPRRSHMGDMDTSLHLMATGGFLEDMMFNRTFWAYWRRWPGFYFANQAPKSGQLLTFDNARTYAAKIFRVRRGLSPDALPGQTGTLLCADDNDNEPILKGEKPGLTPMQWIEPALGKRGHFDNKAVNVNKGTGYTRQTPPVWTRKLPIVVRAMVRAGDRLIVAGPHDRVADDKTPEAFWRGQRGGMIYLLAADSGEVLAEREVDFVPAFDALVAAGDAAWMTTQSGRLIRLGATE